jgi:pilus assembly protein Flp/PilA
MMATFLQQMRTMFRPQTAEGDRGASLIEYALLVALIAVVCISAMSFFGGAVSSQYSSVGASLNAAGS